MLLTCIARSTGGVIGTASITSTAAVQQFVGIVTGVVAMLLLLLLLLLQAAW
jgi:hypothetical protein